MIRPPADDAAQSDAYNRLLGELHIHGFEALIMDRDPGGDPVATLSAVANKHGALAALRLVRDETTLWLAVVVIDRQTGEASTQRLEFDNANGDAASMIAVRAVDLLRATLLRLPERASPSEPTPTRSEPAPVAAAVAQPTKPPPPIAASLERRQPEPLRHWSLTIEGAALRSGERFGVGVGPALGVYHRALPWLQFGLSLAGPTLGARLRTATDSARIWQASALLEAQAAFLRMHGFALAATLGAGGFFLQAKGNVHAPLVAERNSVGSGLLAIGVRAEQRMSQLFAIGLSVRAFALAPALGVAILNERATLPLPLLQVSIGAAVAFE